MLSLPSWHDAVRRLGMGSRVAIDSGWAALGIESLVFLVAMAAAWTRMTAKINGYGSRQRQYEADCARTEGELRQLSIQMAELLSLAGRVSSNEGKITELSEGLTETKLLFVAQVGEVKNSISDKNGVLGERIARLEPKHGGGNA